MKVGMAKWVATGMWTGPIPARPGESRTAGRRDWTRCLGSHSPVPQNAGWLPGLGLQPSQSRPFKTRENLASVRHQKHEI
jgi:hypothetical protein